MDAVSPCAAIAAIILGTQIFHCDAKLMGDSVESLVAEERMTRQLDHHSLMFNEYVNSFIEGVCQQRPC